MLVLITLLNWFTHLRALLAKYDLVDLLNSYAYVSVNVYKNIKQVVLNRFEMNLMSSIQNRGSTKRSKLKLGRTSCSNPILYMYLTSGYTYQNTEIPYID